MTYKTWVRVFIPKITKYKKIVRTHSKSKCVTNSQHFKKKLQLLPLEDQVFEINCLIDDITKDPLVKNVNKKYARIKELKKLKHDIILNMHTDIK